MVDGLVAFYRARLDEIEATARTALVAFIRFPDARPGDWSRLMCDPVMGPFGGQTATRDIATGLYVGKMSDPARVLREVEAGRGDLAEYIDAEAQPDLEDDDFTRGELMVLRRVVKRRAAVYSDHPDYQAGWKP